jgi:predicted amidohydrolase YtcJ
VSTRLVVRDAELDGRRVDVVVDGGLVVAIAAAGSMRGPGDVIEAAGGALLPGLHDHHVHLLAMAAAEGSVAVGPADVVGRAGLAAALRDAPAHPDGWVRAVGYHESVAGEVDRHLLDELHPARPVRVQHRSGALWRNSPLAAIVSDDPTGACSATTRGSASGCRSGRSTWRRSAGGSRFMGSPASPTSPRRRMRARWQPSPRQ